MATSAKPPAKAKTAYFIFTEENRDAAKQQLLAERGEGAKVSVAEVAKELGSKWKALTDEEREAYQAKAQEGKKVADAARAAWIQEHGEEALQADAEAEASTSGPAVQLPISLVKRIIQFDKDVMRLSHDATLVVTAAAGWNDMNPHVEMFLELLTERCAHNATNAKPKRRTIKLEDFENVIKRDRRLVAASLRDVVAAAQGQAADAAAVREAKQVDRAAEKAAAAANAGEAEGEAEGQQDAGSPQGDGEAGAGEVAGGGGAKVKAGRGRPKGSGAPAAKKAKAEAPVKQLVKPITSFFARVQQ